jgi:CRP-like cAMP-binding protein
MNQHALPLRMLHEIPLFENFTDEECDQVANMATAETYRPGQVVLRQGTTSRNLWIVLHGECEVVRVPEGNHREVLLATLGKGQNFGEMSFFHEAPHSASVRAKTDVKLLRITRADYDRMAHENCPAAYKLAFNTVESLADRVRRLNDMVVQLTAAKDPPATHSKEWENFRANLMKEWNL